MSHVWELGLQWAIDRALKAAGFKFQKEVCFSYAGGWRITADFVVEANSKWAIECKLSNKQDSLLKALGQCVAYSMLGMAERTMIVLPRFEIPQYHIWRACIKAGVLIVCEPDVVQAISEAWPCPQLPDGGDETVSLFYASAARRFYDSRKQEEQP